MANDNMSAGLSINCNIGPVHRCQPAVNGVQVRQLMQHYLYGGIGDTAARKIGQFHASQLHPSSRIGCTLQLIHHRDELNESTIVLLLRDKIPLN